MRNDTKRSIDLLSAAVDRIGCHVDDIAYFRPEPVFDRQIFMGSGDNDPRLDFTGQNIELLRAMLEESLRLISGMQQNGGMGTDFRFDEHVHDMFRLNRLATEIYTALTGEKPR